MAIAYNIPKGNTAAYYPKVNPLVPVASVADISSTPTSKFIIVTIEPIAEILPEDKTEAVTLEVVG